MLHKRLPPRMSAQQAPVTEPSNTLSHLEELQEMKTGVKHKIDGIVDNMFGFITELTFPNVVNETSSKIPSAGSSSSTLTATPQSISSHDLGQSPESCSVHLKMPQHGDMCICCSCIVDSVIDLIPESHNAQLEDMLEDKNELTEIITDWETHSNALFQSFSCFAHLCEGIYTNQEDLDKHVAEKHPNLFQSKSKIKK